MSVPRLAAMCVAATVAACAQAAPQRMSLKAPPTGKQASAMAASCDAASATVTMYSQTAATHYARARLRDQIGDAQTHLANAGVPLTHAGEAQVSCQPYRVLGQTTSLISCTAVAAVCAR